MNLKVAIAQTDIEWGAVPQNLARAAEAVAGVEADLVVLPEMFATGFMTSPGTAAEEPGGPIAEAMRRWARQYGRTVTGTVAVNESGRLRNRMLWADPSGEVTAYDKRHLFRPGGEADAYAAGDRRVVAGCGGARFLMQICYDLRFPVWSRNRGDYDAIVYCASWSAHRRDVWRTLLRARAIENQCYVIGVNRVGSDPSTIYVGDSAVIDFKGRTVVDAGDGVSTLTAELDFDAQRAFRESFPAWRDADAFRLTEPDEQ